MQQITLGRCGKVNLEVTAPPSKSYTHRALILGALSDGVSLIRSQLDADDTRMTARALSNLGVRIIWEQDRIIVHGTGGRFISPKEPIDIRDSGTSMRLLTTLCLLADGPVTLTGSERMQERPLGPLIRALNESGADIRYLNREGCPPIRIEGSLTGGEIWIDGSVSSQFVSSLLLSSPYAKEDMKIFLNGPPVSAPYILITLEMMEEFGVIVEQPDSSSFFIKKGQKYDPHEYEVEGDFSSASYWFALAAICGGQVTVHHLHSDSKQGDKEMLDLLRKMGCDIIWNGASVTVKRSGPLKGINTDMSASPDIVQSICMVAACAESPSMITGIHHLREKESDRIEAIVDGLSSLGGIVRSSKDSISIDPAPLHRGVIDPRNDHRTAMSFAILACSIGDVTIHHADCVSKSYPEFWKVLRKVW